MDECRVAIKVGLAGQFDFPKGSELMSAVYWLYSPVKFAHPLTLEIQHCAKDEEVSNLCFAVAKCSQKELPYTFKPLSGGVFSQYSSYGSVSPSHFSIFSIIGYGKQHYCSFSYYLGRKIDQKVYFVVTKNLEAHISVSWNTYELCTN